MPPDAAAVDAYLAGVEPASLSGWLTNCSRHLILASDGDATGSTAGYVNTVGFDTDATNIILSEGKWRYRDYVIRAWNEDKPYDRFVIEQLAGDELYDWRARSIFRPKC